MSHIFILNYLKYAIIYSTKTSLDKHGEIYLYIIKDVYTNFFADFDIAKLCRDSISSQV